MGGTLAGHGSTVRTVCMNSAGPEVLMNKHFAIGHPAVPFTTLRNVSMGGLVDSLTKTGNTNDIWAYGYNGFRREIIADISVVNPTRINKDCIGVSGWTTASSGLSYGPGLDFFANAYTVQSYNTPWITGKIARMMYYHP